MTLNPIPQELPALQEAAVAGLRSQFDREASFVAAAPGRVNLIGEHVDYEGGLVLPMAINRHVVIAGAPRDDGRVRIWTDQGSSSEEIDLNLPLQKNGDHWSNYFMGILAQFNRAGVHVGGGDFAIVSSLPSGAGLSSSAALEVAFCLALESLTGHEHTPRKRAKLAQAAEHEFAGVPCGIMDQMAVTHAREGHAMLLDCRSLEIQHSPLSPDLAVLVLNTCTRHALADGEYAKRRTECAQAADVFAASNLRDANLIQLEEKRDQLGELLYRRARHVVSEIRRVRQFVDALAQDDRKSLGWLLKASHASLRDDFEVSCRELDIMQRIASKQESVLGARMTGAGFGGCVIALCDQPSADLADSILQRYEERAGQAGEAYLVRAEGSAQFLTSPAPVAP